MALYAFHPDTACERKSCGSAFFGEDTTGLSKLRKEIAMSDYRDNFDMNPNMHSYYQRERGSLVGPLVALGVIFVMIVGVFFFSGGTGEVPGTVTPAITTPTVN